MPKPTAPRAPRWKPWAQRARRPRAPRSASRARKRRLADVAHEIREMLEVEPADVADLAGIDPGAALPEVAEVEAKLERLRRDRERLGAVNLRAEEELREVETQHGSLTAERDDLVEAIKRLRQGIQNLNREARERLLASFEVVNSHFQRLFTELFGGGTAELQLIENDDPLEAGLEIIAKPPGKKPATLSLLSGGEQALTALALIFAVFLTNPAPICVLDEVDAPLDDHNVDRFCDLLDEMTRSTDTRFVIITHNPITMARMNRLYRRHHGRARHLAARLGRSRRRGEAARSRVAAGPPARPPLRHLKPARDMARARPRFGLQAVQLALASSIPATGGGGTWAAPGWSSSAATTTSCRLRIPTSLASASSALRSVEWR